MTSRRDLFLTLGTILLTHRVGALAQENASVRHVGFLSPRQRPDAIKSDIYGAFLRGLRDSGYVEGRNLEIEWRFADGRYERLPGLAVELVRHRVEVIVADGTPAARAAQGATSVIPIVFTSVSDAVANGVVRSLARPDGNATGVSNLTSATAVKQIEMLLVLLRSRPIVGVLFNPDNPASLPPLKDIQGAFPADRVQLRPHGVRNAEDIESAFPAMAVEHADAFVAVPEALFTQQFRQLAALTMKHRIPGVFASRIHPEAGNLMSYGPDLAGNLRRAAEYVDRILKGAKPGDLPVEQPTKLELVINRKTAKALGLTIPPELLILADKVIE